METAGRVRLVAFAAARDLLGAGELSLPLEAGCSAAELWAVLLERHPSLAPYRAAIQLAVNGTWATEDARIEPGDEVALLPPVSGG